MQNLVYFSRQPFQVAGVIPILRDEEIFEEGKHPDQAHTASKLQSQDPSLSFLIWATLFSFHGPLSLEKGTVENRYQSPGGAGWFRVNTDTGLFPLGQFGAKGCQSVSETLLLP